MMRLALGLANVAGVHDKRGKRQSCTRMVTSKPYQFRGTVTEPVILRSDDAAVKESIRQQIAFGATYEDLRDDLLFNFEHICDVNLFVKNVRHEMNYMQCSSARYPQWQVVHRREQ
jgi:hypothetical protein